MSILLKSSRGLISYSFASTLNSIIKMASGLFILRWLGPDEIGIWNASAIVLSYLPFFHFGVHTALSLDLPVLLGAGSELWREYVKNSRTVGFVIGLIAVFALTIYVLTLSKEEIIAKSNLSIITVGLILLFRSNTMHLIATFRSSKSFANLTGIYVTESIITSLSVLLVVYFDFYGLLIYQFLLVFQHTVLLYIYRPYKRRSLGLNRRILLMMFKRGFVVTSLYQLRVLAHTVPRWMILMLAGSKTLGLFTPIIAVRGLMTMVPNQITQYVQPLLGGVFGRTSSKKVIWPSIRSLVILFPFIGLVLAFASYCILPMLIVNFLNDYREVVPAIKIASFSFVFSSYPGLQAPLYTVKEYGAALLLLIIEFVLYVLVPTIFFYSGHKILDAIVWSLIVINPMLYTITTVVVYDTLNNRADNE